VCVCECVYGGVTLTQDELVRRPEDASGVRGLGLGFRV